MFFRKDWRFKGTKEKYYPMLGNIFFILQSDGLDAINFLNEYIQNPHGVLDSLEWEMRDNEKFLACLRMFQWITLCLIDEGIDPADFLTEYKEHILNEVREQMKKAG